MRSLFLALALALAPSLGWAAAAVSVTIEVDPSTSITTVCTTPVAAGCAIQDNAAVGAAVLSITVGNSANVPVLTDPSGLFAISGTSSPFLLVTAVSPLIDGLHNITITVPQ